MQFPHNGLEEISYGLLIWRITFSVRSLRRESVMGRAGFRQNFNIESGGSGQDPAC